jgi:hypothetical protein
MNDELMNKEQVTIKSKGELFRSLVNKKEENVKNS